MNSRKTLYILLTVLILVALIPTVYALMRRQSQTVTNTFTPAFVDCEVAETMGTVTQGTEVYDAKHQVAVKNTGNVEAYIKVQLIFYWRDSKGVAVGRNVELPADFTEDYINTEDGWIDGGNHTYYYKLPIDPEAYTPGLLKRSIVMHPVNEPYNKVDYIYYPVLEIIAEAIQSVPVSAVQESWGVTISNIGTDQNPSYAITSPNPPSGS